MKQWAAYFSKQAQPRRIRAFAASVILIASVGCQTCSLTEADFQRQQHGQTVDPETGEVVATVGTVGYVGFMLAEIAKALAGK